MVEDLSKFVHPAPTPQHQGGHPLLGQADPYPSEANAIEEIVAQAQIKYGFKPLTGTTMRMMSEEIIGRCAEIGFEVSIDFSPVAVSDNKNDMNLYHSPAVQVEGRISRKPSETDHDRLQHEITSGEADGKAGFIRADGSFHEDPISKKII